MGGVGDLPNRSVEKWTALGGCRFKPSLARGQIAIQTTRLLDFHELSTSYG